MAETAIRPALAAQEIAVDLIDGHHEHLMTARILWLFTTSKRTRGGHVVLGSSSRSNPLQRYLSSGNESVQTGYDYIVLLDEGRWLRALKTQQLALVDHLLCCMVQRVTVNSRSGEMTKTWATVGPDINEFTEVIRRHGVYLPSQQKFATVLRELGSTMRLKFPDLEGEEPKEKPAGKAVKAILAGSSGSEERETVVDGQGTVQTTKRRRASKSRQDANLSTEGLGVQDGTPEAMPASSGVDPDGSGPADTQESEPYRPDPNDDYLPPELEDAEMSTNGHHDAPVPDAYSDGQPWQVTAGIGVSDIAQHRRERERV